MPYSLDAVGGVDDVKHARARHCSGAETTKDGVRSVVARREACGHVQRYGVGYAKCPRVVAANKLRQDLFLGLQNALRLSHLAPLADACC